MFFLRKFLLLILLSCAPASATSLLLNDLASAAGLSFAVPEPKSEHPEIDNLIKSLENDQSRQALITDLKKLTSNSKNVLPAANAHNTVNFIFSELLQDIINIVTDLKDQCLALLQLFKKTGIRQVLFEYIWVAALTLSIGLVTEFLFLRLFRELFAKLQIRAIEGHITKSQIFLIRFAIRTIGILIFVLLAATTMQYLEPESRVLELTKNTIFLTTIFKIFQTLLLIFISPRTEEVRLLPVRNDAAILIYAFFKIVSLSFLIGYCTTFIFHVVKAQDSVIFFVIKLSTIVAGSSIIYFSHRLKPYVNRWIAHDRLIEGKSDHGFNRFIMEIARSWYPVLTVYIGLVIVVTLSTDYYTYPARIDLLLKTLIMLVVTYLLVLIIPKLIRYLLYYISEQHPLIKPRLLAYRRICSAVLLMAVSVMAIVYCASLWNIGFINECIDTSNNKILLQAFSLILILIIGMVAWEINELWTERKFSSSTKTHLTAEADKRLKTLRPLIRNTGRGFIVLLVTTMAFSELGFNIAPILTGASVIGIIFSFGGQNLVKDLIIGSFIVIEDTMNIGDYVELSGHTGRIETMSLRNVTLRDNVGAVHSIPFNSIATIVNYSKTYSVCIFNFKVALSIDKQKVIDTIAAVEKSMQDQPDWAAIIIEPFSIAGVTEFDGGSYTLRAQIKVMPGKQWRFEREINWRLAKAFEQAEIYGPADKKHIIVEQAQLAPTS